MQELLSDAGVGRQQHVIVGQGQLDTVLNSSPAERRAIIEEAAGILKFRRRKERAERRLTATEGNLLRLGDLLREVRRQLGPLQRQADAARRHGAVVEELRAIKLHLAGHQIAGQQTRIERLRDERVELVARDGSRCATACVCSTKRCSGPSRRWPSSAPTSSPTSWCARSRCVSGRAASATLDRREAPRCRRASSRPRPTKAWSRRSSPTPSSLRAEIDQLDADAIAARCPAPTPRSPSTSPRA